VSPYEVLGVDPSASDEEIRKVYVGLARRNHPDFFTGADRARRARADQRMREINEAWQVLGDRERRAAYDHERAVGRSSVIRDKPKRAWQPLEPDDPDEPDPRDLVDDTPIGDGNKPPRAIPLLVTGFFFGSVASFSVGLVARLPGLLVLGIVLFGLAALSLASAPIIALSKSWSNEREADARGS
jgi:curved DNA-binding protein CbpA